MKRIPLTALEATLSAPAFQRFDFERDRLEGARGALHEEGVERRARNPFVREGLDFPRARNQDAQSQCEGTHRQVVSQVAYFAPGLGVPGFELRREGAHALQVARRVVEEFAHVAFTRVRHQSRGWK